MRTGTNIGHYRVGARIGQGGMGEVYRAVDTRLDRPVALKFLAARYVSDPEAKARFIREAKSASALDHPNICTIHDIGEAADGELYIVMALYEGETLDRRLKGETFSLERTVRIIRGSSQQIGISSAPTGAQVHVNGNQLGVTPVLADLKRKDAQLIHVTMEGYQPFEMTLRGSGAPCREAATWPASA